MPRHHSRCGIRFFIVLVAATLMTALFAPKALAAAMTYLANASSNGNRSQRAANRIGRLRSALSDSHRNRLAVDHPSSVGADPLTSEQLPHSLGRAGQVPKGQATRPGLTAYRGPFLATAGSY